MVKVEKWFVQFRDVDGLNFVSSYTGLESWSSSMDTGDVMLFDYERAREVMEELKQHWRYQNGPDNGFYNVTIQKASEKMYSDWCGPSGELMVYLTSSSTKEELVRLMWGLLPLEQRQRLEDEVEEFMKVSSMEGVVA